MLRIWGLSLRSCFHKLVLFLSFRLVLPEFGPSLFCLNSAVTCTGFLMHSIALSNPPPTCLLVFLPTRSCDYLVHLLKIFPFFSSGVRKAFTLKGKTVNILGFMGATCGLCCLFFFPLSTPPAPYSGYRRLSHDPVIYSIVRHHRTTFRHLGFLLCLIQSGFH